MDRSSLFLAARRLRGDFALLDCFDLDSTCGYREVDMTADRDASRPAT